MTARVFERFVLKPPDGFFLKITNTIFLTFHAAAIFFKPSISLLYLTTVPFI